MLNKLDEKSKKKSNFPSIVSGAIFLTLMSNGGDLIATNSDSGIMTSNKIEVKSGISKDINNLSNNYYFGDSLDIYGFDEFILLGQEEKNFLKDRIAKNSYISLSIIDRTSFNELKGDFLTYSGDNEQTKFGNYKKYNLKLPSDLRLGELASIIKRVNEITFDGEMPDYASSIEIKNNIQGVIIYLLSLKGKYNIGEVKKAISKYYKLYQYYFPGEDINIDSTSTNQEQTATKHFSNTIKNLDLKYGGYNFDVIEREVDESLANNIYNHFFESFFENGSEILSNISGLKSKLNIEQLKIGLQTVRNTKNKYLIAKKEKEILNYVIKKIRDLDLESDNIYSNVYSASSPTEIIKTGDIVCVGYSIISSNILEDLGISNNVVTEPGHSLCTVQLSDGKKYLFDALRNDKMVEYNISGSDGAWDLIKYKLSDGSQETNKIIGGNKDSKSILIMQILTNKTNCVPGEDENANKQKLYILNRAINISNTNPEIFYDRAYTLNELGRYKEALSSINYSIKLSPHNSVSRLLKSMICDNLGDYSSSDFANKKYEDLSR